LPGKSLAPALSRDGAIEREYLYFHHSNNRALRVGNSKLVAAGASGPWELYNLASDRSETRNLANGEPEKVERMGAQWQEIDKSFVQSREAARPFPKDAPGLQRLAGRTSGGA
jgi:arylsulfatase